MTPTSCRSCGAPIFWARTTAEKLIPIDAEPVAEGGNVRVDDQGIAHVEAVGAVSLFLDEPRYVSHFVTCPDADDWRAS